MVTRHTAPALEQIGQRRHRSAAPLPSPTHAPSAPSPFAGLPLLARRAVGRGNGAVRAQAVQRMQGVLGNRATRRALRPSAPPVAIQRLPTKAEMEWLAGEPGTGNIIQKSTYVRILDLLNSYHAVEKDAAKQKILIALLQGIHDWLNEHTRDQGGQRVASAEDQRKQKWLEGLEVEVSKALKQKPLVSDPKGMPSAEVQDQKKREAAASEADYEEEVDNPGAITYGLTVAAWREVKNFIPFQEERTKSVIRNKVRGHLTSEDTLIGQTGLFGVRESKKHGTGAEVKGGLFLLSKPKSNVEIKQKAARKVVEKQKGADQIAADEKQKEIQELASRSSAVGHTWVKLTQHEGAALKRVDSFGFWPLGGYTDPKQAVPGYVRHPDRVHEDGAGGQLRFLDFLLKPKQYEAGMRHALKTLAARPAYTLTGYNCTMFAKEVTEKTGKSFPGEAMVTPLGLAYNPNMAYEGLEKKHGYETSSTEKTVAAHQQEKERAAQEQQAAERQQARQEAFEDEMAQYKELKVINDGRMFMGATWDPNNTDDYMAIGPYFPGGDKVYLMDPTPVYAIHKDDREQKKRAWLKVTILIPVDSGPPVREVGWVRAEDTNAGII